MKGTVETSQDEDLLAPRGIGETLCPQQIHSLMYLGFWCIQKTTHRNLTGTCIHKRFIALNKILIRITDSLVD